MRKRRTTPAEQKRMMKEEVKDEEAVKEDVKDEVLSVSEDSLEDVKDAVKEEEDEATEATEATMIKFLMNASWEDKLDKDDWITLDDSVLRRLGASWEEVVEVVRTSARGCQPRFEMTISGPRSWLRATNCSFYRTRSLERVAARQAWLARQAPGCPFN